MQSRRLSSAPAVPEGRVVLRGGISGVLLSAACGAASVSSAINGVAPAPRTPRRLDPHQRALQTWAAAPVDIEVAAPVDTRAAAPVDISSL
jgi:hypothetical protein